MAVFKIWHGAPVPMVARGEHQCKLLRFAEMYKCWHTYNTKCRSTKRAVLALSAKGYLEIDGCMFRFTYPKSR